MPNLLTRPLQRLPAMLILPREIRAKFTPPNFGSPARDLACVTVESNDAPPVLVMTPTMSATLQSIPTEFAPLPLAGLLSAELPPLDLYLPATVSDRAMLYRSAGTPVTERDMNALRIRGISELWISSSEYPRVSQFLVDNLASILANESQPPGERLKLLNQVVTQTLKDSLSCDDPAASVMASDAMAQHMVDIGLRNDLGIRDVAKVAKHDFCTFTHSANVACYSMMLARAVGISDENSLREIASAGMLHDLGKLEIPLAILTKPAKLTNREFAIIQLHPTRGFQMLRDELTVGQLMMVYQHHERLDGKGYPVGCVEDEIHLWGKICAVADVFEALTGKRPYRRPNTAVDALTIMRRGAGSQFDREVFRCWQSHFVKEL
jgi:HD-GYP domain-containing protein (c-di-GMP phosphodiesterase class II)